MKTGIHPNYHTDTVITCSCGQKYHAGSILKEMKIEVCSACHPFYTGRQDHLIDRTGRVDKFKAKMDKAKEFQEKNAPKVEVDEDEDEQGTIEEDVIEEDVIEEDIAKEETTEA